MFRLPDGIPSNNASAVELADYLECECIKSKRRRISILDIFSPILIGSDEIEIDGVDDDYDRMQLKSDEVFSEVDRRLKASNNKYPFRLRGNSLIITDGNNLNFYTYCYLLFCTRFNMRSDRTMAGIDGSLLFERLSALVAREYFGFRAEAMVFGTAEREAFRQKVTDLCESLGEGGQFENKDNVEPDQVKDDKLDLVVWKSFADDNVSKLIGFGQCKTGLSWRSDNSLTQLRPSSFCRKWFSRMPVHDPARLFFVADTFKLDTWYRDSSDAGIVFDRFRIMDYLPNDEEFDNDIFNDLVNWTDEAIERISS